MPSESLGFNLYGVDNLSDELRTITRSVRRLQNQLEKLDSAEAEPEIRLQGADQTTQQLHRIRSALLGSRQGLREFANSLRVTRAAVKALQVGLIPVVGTLSSLATIAGVAAGAVAALGAAASTALAGLGAFAISAAGNISKVQTAMEDVTDAQKEFRAAAQKVNVALSTSAKIRADVKQLMQGLPRAQQQVISKLGDETVKWTELTKAQKQAAIQIRESKVTYDKLHNSQKDALNALIDQRDALMKLNPVQRKFAATLWEVKAAYEAFQKATQRQTLSALTEWVKLAEPALKRMVPLSNNAADAIGELGRSAQNRLKGQFWTELYNLLVNTTGPAIRKFGHIAMNVIAGVAGIIKAFIPTGMQFLTWLKGVSASFAEWGKSLSGSKGFQTWVQHIKDAAPTVLAFFKQLGRFLGFLVKGFLILGPPLLRVITYFMKLGNEILAAIMPALMSLWKVIQNQLIPALKPLMPIFKWIANFVKGALIGAFKGIIRVIKGIAQFIAGFFNVIVGIVTLNGEKIKKGLGQMWQGIKNIFLGAIQAIWNIMKLSFVGGIKKLVVGFMKRLPKWIWAGLKAVWNFFKRIFTRIYGFVSNIFRGIWFNISTIWGMIWGFFKSILGKIWRTVWGAFKRVYRFIVNIFQRVLSYARSSWNRIWSTITGFVKNIYNTIVNWFNKALDWLRGLGSKFLNIGKDLIGGLLRGIWNAMKGIGNWLKEHVWDPIVNGIKSLFGISSPSKVFEGFGFEMIRGLIKGMFKKFSGKIISKIFGGISQAAGKALRWLVQHGIVAFRKLLSMATSVWNKIKGLFGSTRGGDFGGVYGYVARVGHLMQRLHPGITSIGGVAPRSNPSDHPRGLALDFMVGRRAGDALVKTLMKSWRKFNIEYLIWRQRIWNPPRTYWRGMADRGGPTANHMDHVHASFLAPHEGGRRRFAVGGIVRTRTRAILGEQGGEIVLPLGRPDRARMLMRKAGLGGGGSAIGTMNVYTNPNAPASEIIEEALFEARRAQMSGGL